MRLGGPDARAGFSIVELLVAGLVLVVVLGATGIFFALQVQLQRDVQNRNDVQDRIRVALQLVTQDLALAGNTVRMSSAGSIEVGTGFGGCYPQSDGGQSCLELEDTSVTETSSTLRMRYVSSQFPLAESCRDVAYLLDDGVLQRSDVACGSTEDPIDLAPNVLAFKTVVVCSTGTRFASYPVGGCGGGSSYARSALVSVAAASIGAVNSGSGPMSVAAVTGTTPVPCPAARACFDGTQEVLMPNLKDQ